MNSIMLAALLCSLWITIDRVFDERNKQRPKRLKAVLTKASCYQMAVPFGMILWMFLDGSQNISGFDPLLSGNSVLLLLGTVIGLVGLWLRWKGREALGPLFSNHVLVFEEHVLVVTGVYRWVRHPLYLGYLLILLGIVLILHSAIGMLFLMLGVVPSLTFRIFQEERWLEKQFGPLYRDYANHTARLVPGVF